MTRLVSDKSMRPSEVIEQQQAQLREQEELIQVLKGALAATGLEVAPDHGAWTAGLPTQARFLVGILYAAYPRAISRAYILEGLPGHDHAVDRQLQIVDVAVHKVRKKMGPDAIVTERGVGFKLGRRFYEALPKGGSARIEPIQGERRTFKGP